MEGGHWGQELEEGLKVMTVILRRTDSGPHVIGHSEVVGGKNGNCKNELVLIVNKCSALHFKEHEY